MKVVIARHGNTFDKGDIIRRVGARTDLPLSRSGQAQVAALGKTLAETYGTFDACYVSELQRTQQTATAILTACGQPSTYQICAELNEVDYGEDDGKPEAEVVERLGEEAIQAWDEHDQVPSGWLIDPERIKAQWHQLAKQWTESSHQTILVVTSNGIARFIDALLPAEDCFFLNHGKKLRTAAYGVVELLGEQRRGQQQWQLLAWGLRGS